MNQEDRIYASKVISIQDHHGNIIHNNHGNGTQRNKDFKVFEKHRVNDHLLTLLLSMDEIIQHLKSIIITFNFPHFLESDIINGYKYSTLTFLTNHMDWIIKWIAFFVLDFVINRRQQGPIFLIYILSKFCRIDIAYE